VKEKLKSIVESLKKNPTPAIQKIADCFSGELSYQLLINNLSLLQVINFNGGLFTPSKLASVDHLLPPSVHLEKVTPRTIPYTYETFRLLCNLQSTLAEILNQPLSVCYDQLSIDQSPIFSNYAETTKNKNYERGSLVTDLTRGITFVHNQTSEDMAITVKNMTNELASAKKEIEELQKLKLERTGTQEGSAEANAEIETIDKKIEALKKQIEQIKPFLKNRFLFIKKLADGDDNKADILNRFGHQMIYAELMSEAQRLFKVSDPHSTTIVPYLEIESQRKHHVVNDNGKIYIDIDLQFGALLCEKTGRFGRLDNISTRRNIAWYTGSYLGIPENKANFQKLANENKLLETKARVELVEDQKNQGTYWMEVKSFEAISFSPDLVSRLPIPQPIIEAEGNLTSFTELR
jgi:hypothetical protein